MNGRRRSRSRPARGTGRTLTIAWTTLTVAGLLEIAWSLALAAADGLTRPWWAVAGIALAMISLGMLSCALRELPVGTAYAAWVGIGAVGVAVTGMLWLGDPASWQRLMCLGLIVAGVIGLNRAEPAPGPGASGSSGPVAAAPGPEGPP
ncbi:DMT family transporter [Prauserella alba]|uniref:Quaternary ammonium compound-resistance protein SugE n=1 Tax=Prauserella alba TaxID=176898 RepID=A0ABN1V2R4_9PSEU|nr:multidrug efflux SMR transporter [Prauserella alba]MCP2180405.1 quaternary ammonium compound-resistance protein SugE [Prauserella alba]